MRLSLHIDNTTLHCRNIFAISCTPKGIREFCPIGRDKPDIKGLNQERGCLCKSFGYITAFPGRI
jgi:hypothetical protein